MEPQSHGAAEPRSRRAAEPQSRGAAEPQNNGGARRSAGTPGARRAAAYQAITRPLRRIHPQPAAVPTRAAATAR